MVIKMKRVKPAIIMLLLIPAVIFISHFYLKNVTGKMSDILGRAQQLAQNGDNDGAAELVSEFNGEWDKNKAIIATFVKHNELDTVNLSAAKLQPYIKNDNTGDFCAECETLKVQLKHIWESEKFSLDNIF